MAEIASIYDSLISKIFVEIGNGLDSFEELLERIVLVGGMDVVAAKSKAHQDALCTKDVFESGNDGDATTTTGGDGAFAIGGLHCLFGRLICFHF